MDRDAFLARVRRQLAGVAGPSLPETLPATRSSGDGRLFERFAEELPKVGGEARRLPAAELAEAVAEAARGCATAVVASGVVTWVRRHGDDRLPGYGVRFTKIDEAHQECLRALLTRRREASLRLWSA